MADKTVVVCDCCDCVIEYDGAIKCDGFSVWRFNEPLDVQLCTLCQSIAAKGIALIIPEMALAEVELPAKSPGWGVWHVNLPKAMLRQE